MLDNLDLEETVERRSALADKLTYQTCRRISSSAVMCIQGKDLPSMRIAAGREECDFPSSLCT